MGFGLTRQRLWSADANDAAPIGPSTTASKVQSVQTTRSVAAFNALII